MNRRVTIAVVSAVSLVALIAGLFIWRSGSPEQGDAKPPSRGQMSLLTIGDVVPPVAVPAADSLNGSTLTIAVAYLPAGARGDVTVRGPSGYRQQIAKSTTLSGLAPGRYQVDASTVEVDGVRTAPVLASQDVRVSAEQGAFVQVEYANRVATNYVEVPADTVMAAEFTSAGLVSGLTLSQDLLELGSIFALGTGPQTPEGAIGYVKSVAPTAGGQFSYDVGQASLQDAIPQGKVILATDGLSFDDADTLVESSRNGGGSAKGASARIPASGMKDLLKSVLAVCEYNKSLNVEVPDGPTVKLTPRVEMGWGWDWDYADTGARAWVSANVSLTISDGFSVKSTAELKCDSGDITVAHRVFPPVDLQIGPVPLVFVPDGQLLLRATADAKGAFEFHAGYTIAGSAWTSLEARSTARTWADAFAQGDLPIVTRFEDDVTGPTFEAIPPTLMANGSASANLSITGKITFLLYGLAGPFASATAGPQAVVEAAAGGSTVEQSSASATAKVGLNVGIGVGIDTSFCGAAVMSPVPDGVCDLVAKARGELNAPTKWIWEGQSRWVEDPADPCQGVPNCQEQEPAFVTNSVKQDRIGWVPADETCIEQNLNGDQPCAAFGRVIVASGTEGLTGFQVPVEEFDIQYVGTVDVLGNGLRQIAVLNTAGAHGLNVTVAAFTDGEFKSVTSPSSGQEVFEPLPTVAGQASSVWSPWAGIEYGLSYRQDAESGRAAGISTCQWTRQPDDGSSNDPNFWMIDYQVDSFSNEDSRWVQTRSDSQSQAGFNVPAWCLAATLPSTATRLTIEPTGCDTEDGCTFSLARTVKRAYKGATAFTTPGKIAPPTTSHGEPVTFTIPTGWTDGLVVLATALGQDSRPGGSATAIAVEGKQPCWIGTKAPAVTWLVDVNQVGSPRPAAEDQAKGLVEIGNDVPVCRID